MTNTLIRPAWTPVTIAMMIIGFMVFWPLGLAMIAYITWGDRLDNFKGEVNRATDRFADSCSRHARGGHSWHRAPSGNVAFDEWREQELERLDEERRKLNEMRKEFEDYSRELRRAKDKDEFDRFMAARDAPVAKESKKPPRKSGGKKVTGK
jgi:biopolymer transport protein ExbB/TolQ